MLACELVREGVDAAHALQRDQEGLVAGQPGAGETRHLPTQLTLQGRKIDGFTALPTAEVGAPLLDLLFECCFGICVGHWFSFRGLCEARMKPRRNEGEFRDGSNDAGEWAVFSHSDGSTKAEWVIPKPLTFANKQRLCEPAIP
jgi:hypothetical protein